ncbi:DUF599 family protein [Roseateles cellulosilyticus]|uniref:DUF599 domain-containing protein n=1 Tax=Pelomonas cellulosilytica TaxID=2906762 RepID=A0ABS8XXL5_9BURK|nr:DUF599 family protein [Pelomonas sp. P8]MCE4555351.1 DUF599 domain-containing protein [Pelomonas sp. P8]
MQADWVWVGLTLAVLALYEAVLVLPQSLALARHAGLREEWFRVVSVQKGSEVLAVQTLRNSLMSATMLASTAALALMGTVSLAAPSLHEGFDAAGGPATLGPRLVLELVLLALLFASLVSSMMAVRFYNHAGFIGGMPVDSEARARWTGAGVRYVRRAGVLYGVGLRQLVLVVPVVATLLLPASGPVAAVVVAAVLYSLDRFNDVGARS